jgi:hypothetical protein
VVVIEVVAESPVVLADSVAGDISLAAVLDIAAARLAQVTLMGDTVPVPMDAMRRAEGVGAGHPLAEAREDPTLGILRGQLRRFAAS